MQRPRWACSPWYCCKCYCRPVARTTMLKHRRTANRVRQRLGRGKCNWGPKVTDPMLIEYTFRCWDTLEDHTSDNEKVGGGQLDVHEDQGDYICPSLIPRAPIFEGTLHQCDELRGQRGILRAQRFSMEVIEVEVEARTAKNARCDQRYLWTIFNSQQWV